MNDEEFDYGCGIYAEEHNFVMTEKGRICTRCGLGIQEIEIIHENSDQNTEMFK